jgi:hypothetical protein
VDNVLEAAIALLEALENPASSTSSAASRTKKAAKGEESLYINH